MFVVKGLAVTERSLSPAGPLRVLYVARAPFVSGAERALMSTLRHLDRSVICPALVLGTQTSLVEQAQCLDLPVTLVALPRRSRYRPLAWWRSVGTLGRVVRQFQPDLIHANDVPSCQAASVIGHKTQIRRVLHVRWTTSATDAAWWARCGVECVICISRWIRQQLGDTTGSALGGADIQTVPDAVDWPAIDSDSGADRIESTSPNGPTLGFAGQIIESKGLALVIQAMGRIPKKARPRLVIAGEDTQTGGAYQKQLVDLSRRCGVFEQITWLGFLEDVSHLYRQVSAMVCPSRIEPLGLIPLEAARFGVPTFANRVGGFTETIQDGVTGFLVEPTVEAWTEALSRIHDPKRLEQLGRAAYARTRRHYAPAVYQQRLEQIYRRVMERPVVKHR